MKYLVRISIVREYNYAIQATSADEARRIVEQSHDDPPENVHTNISVTLASKSDD